MDSQITIGEHDQLDTGSATWRAVRAWATAHLEEIRERNDHKMHGEVATAFFRGQIAQLKELLALPGEKNG